MEYRQTLAVYGWFRENYAGIFLDDIINIVFIFYRLKMDSNILSNDEQESLLNLLIDTIKNQKENGLENLNLLNNELLYRASEHNFSAREFYKSCDVKKPTITIIQSGKDHVFGGYTTQRWSNKIVRAGTKRVNDPNTFLFMIRPKVKAVFFNQRYAKTGQTAIWVYEDYKYGPIFGYGDICIGDECNEHRNNNDTSIYICI